MEDGDGDVDEETRALQIAIMLSLKEEEAAAREVPSIRCEICEEDYKENDMYRVSFCCNHRYCARCILEIFSHRNSPLYTCPGCKANGKSDYEPHFIPPVAFMLIDPHFASQVPGVAQYLVNGNQLRPFISCEPSRSAAARQCNTCPRCSSFVPATNTTEVNQNIMRCVRNECGFVYCHKCSREWHSGLPCVEESETVAKDAQFIEKYSKRCPGCSTAVIHYRGHGCHRVSCPRCSTYFCYICSAPVKKHPSGVEALDLSTCICSIFCNDTRDSCGCIPCPDCKKGAPCSKCDGDCVVCKPI